VKQLIAQILKFGVVGLIAFAIDFALLLFLTEVGGLNYLISATIAFAVAVVFNYFASVRFVYTVTNPAPAGRQFVIFIILSIIGLVLNNLCMWFGVEFLAIDYRITKVIATVIVMVYNFISRKLLLEQRPSHNDR
jgi:putative flippase GtrA